MHEARRNAAAVCTCLVCLTAAYTQEQFSDDPLDITPPDAQYTAGTIVAQHVRVPLLPHGPIEPVSVVRQFRSLR